MKQYNIIKAKCNKCKGIFDLHIPVELEKKTMKEILKHLFGSVTLLCPECKKKCMLK